MKSFGTRELVRCLKCLGFVPAPQVGSRHLKYCAPSAGEKGKRPFIIVIQRRNTYDPIWQKAYIRQIKSLGFTQEEITKCMD